MGLDRFCISTNFSSNVFNLPPNETTQRGRTICTNFFYISSFGLKVDNNDNYVCDRFGLVGQFRGFVTHVPNRKEKAQERIVYTYDSIVRSSHLPSPSIKRSSTEWNGIKAGRCNSE